ncbi:MAG: transglycosylase SLT domain-containing protein [Deltaproteobacteria bacterium]|nr:transglycosylase SLT domain-containing protein [Deltaproteobacteria bacterium]
MGDGETKAEKVKTRTGLKFYSILLLGVLLVLTLPSLSYLYNLRSLLGHYDRAEFLRISDFDLKVLETKKAIDSLKINRLDEKLTYQYAVLITKNADTFELDPLDVVSVIYLESRFNPQAVSTTADYGLMGINWHYVGRHQVKNKKDLFDVETNIRIGVKMLNFWRQYSRKNTSGKKLSLSFFGHYNQGVVIQNGNYAKKIMTIRRKLALQQILGPNLFLTREANSPRSVRRMGTFPVMASIRGN